MASDRQQFKYALDKWDTLRREGAYSVPADVGAVAILASGYAMTQTGWYDEIREINAYEKDAYNLHDRLSMKSMHSYVITRFTKDDVFDVLRDPLTSSVITIGNGDLTSIYIDDERLVDWRHLAVESTHLKTGFFEQRHCGKAVRDLSVPLGTFAVCRHNAVRAAVNQPLPTEMTTSHEAVIRPIHRLERLTYADVKSLLPHHYDQDPDKEDSSSGPMTQN